MITALDLAQQLIRCASITPADAGAQKILASALTGLGFTVHALPLGEAPDGPVENLFATIGEGAPHFAFAGHTDVVPTGELAAWSSDPFAAVVSDGHLVGRGAADMKGAIAAFVVAAGRHIEARRGHDAPGRLSLIITGDEEGPATFGTNPMLDWIAAQGLTPDACLVGEPTSARVLGDTIKVGRRGSINAWITVNGAQGHVAYPDRADNPITRLVAIMAALKARPLDSGSDWFDPSNLEFTEVAAPNPATNVIPAQARARLNIRFNDHHQGVELEAWLRATVADHAPSAEVQVSISGESFLTEPGPLSTLVSAAVTQVTGVVPVLSTTGGTSDARFIRRLCPVVEFGLPGASMHKIDESVRVSDLDALTDIYTQVLARYFA